MSDVSLAAIERHLTRIIWMLGVNLMMMAIIIGFLLAHT